jgi:hypothetical protein
MKNQSEHKLYKELKREVVHKEWLVKNLPKSKQARDNQKRILQLCISPLQTSLIIMYKDDCVVDTMTDWHSEAL